MKTKYSQDVAVISNVIVVDHVSEYLVQYVVLVLAGIGRHIESSMFTYRLSVSPFPTIPDCFASRKAENLGLQPVEGLGQVQ